MTTASSHKTVATERTLGLRGLVHKLKSVLSEESQLVVFTFVWAILVLVPMIGVMLMSFLQTRGLSVVWSLSFDAYYNIIDTGRLQVIMRTLRVAALVTIICFVVGFPFALWLAKRARSEMVKQFVWMCLTVPFFLDPSARTLVWRAVLGTTGVINSGLIKLGIVSEPLTWLLFSDFSILFGMVPFYFPNMVWPIYLALILIDDDLLGASKDLGATPFQTLRTVILPLAVPGIVAGFIFTFVPVLGDNVVTRLLGGGKQEYIADSVMSLVTTMNYTGAAAFATIVLGLSLLFVGAFGLLNRSRTRPAGETT